MEENTSLFRMKDDLNITSEFLGNDNSLLDMEGFETVESSSTIASDMNIDNNLGRDLLDDFTGNFQSGLMSTTRPLSTSKEDIKVDDRSISPSLHTSNLSEFVSDKNSSLVDTVADTRVEDTFRDPTSELFQCSDDDRLLIDEESRYFEGTAGSFTSSNRAGGKSSISFSKVLQSESEESLPKARDLKIGSQAKEESDNYEIITDPAYETAAQPALKREVAMEAETIGNAKNSEDCPFTAGIILKF